MDVTVDEQQEQGQRQQSEPQLSPRRVSLWRERIDPHLVSLTDPESAEAECYRRLRYAIESHCRAEQGVLIAICGAAAGDGKTITSVNLAGALAQSGDARVLIIDLDLRRGDLCDYLNLDREIWTPGLVDKIDDPDMMWDEAVRYLHDVNLHVMPAGQVTEKPYEVLKSEMLGEIFAEAKRRYDFVIIDTPPGVLLTDSQLISKRVDYVLVVVSADRTPKPVLEETLNYMDPDKVLGFVFNCHEPAGLGRYDSYAYSRLHLEERGFATKVGDALRRLGIRR